MSKRNDLQALRAAIAEGHISHSRFSPRFGGIVYVYERDRTSPTGVRCFASFDKSPELDSILRGGLSPLSPTEGR